MRWERNRLEKESKALTMKRTQGGTRTLWDTLYSHSLLLLTLRAAWEMAFNTGSFSAVSGAASGGH